MACIVLTTGEDDVTKLLKDSGVAVDKDNLKVLMEKMSGKSVPELIAEGSKQFAAVPAGGSGAPAAGGATAAAAEEKEAPKEEEPEEDVDMGDLFGGDDY